MGRGAKPDVTQKGALNNNDPMLFDTHAHLNFKDYDKDREKVIRNSLEEGVFMINVGTDINESKKVAEISKKHKKGVYSSIGLHPLYVEKEDFENLLPEYENLARSSVVVAIGETGLDLQGKNMEKQRQVFLKHIQLAEKSGLPLILHCRKAHEELIELISNSTSKGVIHCFTGGEKELKEYLEMGFYIGFNGIIFKMNLEKEIRETPLERILLETDCPFLTPPEAKTERNEPLFVKYIAKEIARIKRISVKEVAKVTTRNAVNLFKL